MRRFRVRGCESRFFLKGFSKKGPQENQMCSKASVKGNVNNRLGHSMRDTSFRYPQSASMHCTHLRTSVRLQGTHERWWPKSIFPEP